MRRLMFARVIVIALGLVSALAAQQPAGPPQPTSPSQAPTPGAPSPVPPRAGRPTTGPAKGTAILRGYVVAADSGNPVRRAMVRVFAATGGVNATTSTDAEGRWELKNLPAASYTISVSKAGFASASYGQRSPEQMGRPLEVLDGQLVEKIGFTLIRGGVITGRITDEFGEPVAGAQVSAMRYRFVGGSRRLTPAGTAQTDDLGAFRIYGLVPGEYHVMSTVRSMMMNMPGSRTTDVEGYAPTYYPGTTNAGQSQRLVVRASQETTNISFALSAAMLTTISGRVISSNNEPVVQANIRVTPADRNDAMAMMMFNSAMTAADGAFEVSGMTPGNYILQVFPRSFDGRMSEFGRLRVTVGDDNLENVVVVMSRGAVLQGTITTDEGTPLPVAPQQVNVFVRPVEPEMMPMGGGAPKVNDDWTFEVSNLNDRSIISAVVTADSGGWVVKGVYHNGLEITDAPTDFAPGQTVEGVQIVFTRKVTVVSGTITDTRGRPDLDATVVAFAQDARRWTPMTRFTRSARPNQDGRYTLRGLPPEDYFVAVVKEIEPGRLADPEYLESLRDQAVRITIGEAETKALDLKSPLPR